MRVRDITNDWIRENFNLESERKIKKKKVEKYIVTFEELYKDNVDDFIAKLQNEVDDFKMEFHVDEVAITQRKAYFYEDSKDEFVLSATMERMETDSEVISMLKSREKQKVKRILDKEAEQRRELATFERLNKKYGKEKQDEN